MLAFGPDDLEVMASLLRALNELESHEVPEGAKRLAVMTGQIPVHDVTSMNGGEVAGLIGWIVREAPGWQFKPKPPPGPNKYPIAVQ